MLYLCVVYEFNIGLSLKNIKNLGLKDPLMFFSIWRIKDSKVVSKISNPVRVDGVKGQVNLVRNQRSDSEENSPSRKMFGRRSEGL